MKKQLIGLLNKLPYIRGLNAELNQYKYINRFYPGHYHSPIPDVAEVKVHYDALSEEIRDINFDFKNQEAMLKEMLPFYKDLPWSFTDDNKNKNYRYKNEKSYYRYSDAIFLYLMLRKYQPTKIIEIGSGFSSAIMLDTNEHFFKENPIRLTFIEPNPQDRLNNLISEQDKKNCTIYAKKVQDVDLEIYKELRDGDILFVDSSHVSKTGSDLNFILFNILPLLNKGVIIHFHDIFYPFEYPKDWITNERFFWNECYLLRAFLMNNHDYDIVLFNSAAHRFHYDFLLKNMPDILTDHKHCGALWIRKK